MNSCLICGASMDSKPKFHQIFLLKKEDYDLCQDCKSGFEPISNQHCPSCYKEGEENVCQDCCYWQERGQLVAHQSLYRYNAAMKDFFSHYKFQGDYLLRHVFAQELKAALINYKGYALVPLPVSQERFQKRGFNQVTGFLEATGLPYQDLLQKAETATQSSKNRAERLQTEQSFALIEDKKLPEKILLIDDIYTTGATLQLARRLFFENGVKEIRTFSLAR